MVKPWVLLLLPAFLLGAVPTVDRPVVNPDGLMSPGDVEAVADALVRLRQETGAQMAVLVVRTTGGEPIEDYAVRAAEAWKGGAQGRDDGLLLVLAVDDRRQRLEVGYGLEEHLPDDAVRTLLDAQRGLLRAGDYRGAVLGVVQGVRSRLPGAGEVVGMPKGWSNEEMGHVLLWMMGVGLIVGVLVGLYRQEWKDRLGIALGYVVSGALLGGPGVAIFLALPREAILNFQAMVAYAIFCALFYVVGRAWHRDDRAFAILMAVSLLLGGGLVSTVNSPASLVSRLAAALFMALFPFALGGIPLLIYKAFQGFRSSRTYRSRAVSGTPRRRPVSSVPSHVGVIPVPPVAASAGSTAWESSSSSSDSSSWSSSSSDSSSSGSSWDGGGGSFGGGGASSDW